MAKTRQQKQAQVEVLTQELTRSAMTVVVAYSGMSVKQAEELRTEAKNNNGNFRVVKNAMFKLAASRVYSQLELTDITGPIAVITGYDDQVMPAKTAVNYAQESQILEPIAGVNGFGQRLSADEIKRLASLPSRHQLQGQLVGTLAAPLSGMVTSLGGNLRGLVTALDSISRSQEQSAG
jgi:large subunit ribosomal protein L10